MQMEEQIIWGDAADGAEVPACGSRGSRAGGTPAKRTRTSSSSASGRTAAAPLRPSSDAAAWATASQLQGRLGDADLAQVAFVRHVARWEPTST